MNAREEINAMVKSSGWFSQTVTDFFTPIFERQNRKWRREHGLPAYPFTGGSKYNSDLGAAQAVADAYPAANKTPWKPKAYRDGKRVTF